MLRIPFTSRASETGLKYVIERAAAEAGVTTFQVAWIVSHFLEALTDAVALGKSVTIPGVGHFGPWKWSPRIAGAKPVVLPRFVASRGWKQQVAVGCPPFLACNVLAERYRRRNTTRVTAPMTSERSFTALSAFRDRIEAQAKRIGLDARLSRAGDD